MEILCDYWTSLATRGGPSVWEGMSYNFYLARKYIVVIFYAKFVNICFHMGVLNLLTLNGKCLISFLFHFCRRKVLSLTLKIHGWQKETSEDIPLRERLKSKNLICTRAISPHLCFMVRE